MVKTYARTAGVLYLMVTILGMYAVYGPSNIRVPGDVQATVQNLVAHEFLWRTAIASNIVAGLVYVAVTMMLYRLTLPIAPALALLTSMFSICGVAIGVGAEAFRLFPLLLDAHSEASLVDASIRLYGQGETISLIFFGAYCLLLGTLIYRSTYMPRWIGAFMMLGGVCYWVDCFSTILIPRLSHDWPSFSLISALAELALTIWLLAFGVNLEKWPTTTAPSDAHL